MKELLKSFIKFVTSRLFIITVIIIGLFSIMVFRLFELQIVKGEEYQKNSKMSILRKLSIPAPRGTIYDKYSRPLAINNVAYAVKIDNSVLINDEAYKNEMYMDLIRKIEKNGDSIIVDLPISETRPYTFLFNGSINKEVNWKRDKIWYRKGIKSDMSNEEMRKILEDVTAEQVMEYLKDFFKIDSKLSDEEARKLISIRYSIYLRRYTQYQPITIALEVSDKTVAILEEENDKYPGVYIEAESLRIYPEKGLFSHILGYTGSIDDKEFADLKYYTYGIDENGKTVPQRNETYDEKNSMNVYTPNDIIGKTGMEKSMEMELNGIDGEMFVEVNPNGRRVNTIDTSKEAEPGKKIYLTIDRDLQEVAYNALVEQLKNTLLLKLDPGSTANTRITLKELFTSMINANRFSIESILNSAEGSYQYVAKYAILRRENAFELKTKEDIEYAKQMLSDAVQLGELSSKQMILIMHEQGMITGDNNFIAGVNTGALSPLKVIKDKIISNEITPQDTALDPCSGSLAITNVKTGEVLAMATYPTYDNNELVNNLNYDYYKNLLEDPTEPLINRPLYQRSAPGSTFKMISALAGLETGVITTTGTIYDGGSFDKAGNPPARCWLYNLHGSSHGAINVSKALEVSCNYFFYESTYRMVNVSSENRFQGIETLNKYMKLFGLGAKTGVEIGEAYPIMASPEYKKAANPDASRSQTRWTDGDTIRVAIGQSDNNYTTANMAKYIATLANGGSRYKMHLVGKLEDIYGNIQYKEPEIEEKILLDENNLKAVYKGMHNVTRGSNGTLTQKFKDYPIEIAAKTGTAQEKASRNSHTWFVAFAPLEEPQISIAVMIPFGDVTTYPAAEVAKTVIASYMGLDSQAETKTMNNTLSK